MWSSLPSNLRAVLGTALLLGIGVAAAAFALSFFALRDAASDPALGWGQGHAWLFPIGIDAALIFFEVLLIGASMVRVQGPRGPEPYPRAVPLVLVLLAGAATLYFNATRVPTVHRPVALAVPVASILVTLGLAYLLKMLTTASGIGVIHLAPPTVDPRPIVRSSDVLQAQAWREPVGSSRWGERSEVAEVTGQTGHGWGSGGVVTTKRQQIESYLDYLGPEAALGLGARKITNDLRKHGVDVSERYVKQAMDDRGAAPSANGHVPGAE